MNLFILETPPQLFHQYLVLPTSGAIHTDLNAMVFQQPGELLARELAALPVLMSSGIPYQLIASYSASTQKSMARVLESRQASTRRLTQSRITQKVDEAPSHPISLTLEDIALHPGAGKRMLQVQFVYPTHESQRHA